MKKILILLFLAMLIAGCKISYKTSTGYKPLNADECSTPGGGYFCTEQYDPVCGSDGKTYSNSCKACTAEIKWYVKGECK